MARKFAAKSQFSYFPSFNLLPIHTGAPQSLHTTPTTPNHRTHVNHSTTDT
jgi:hypothetical protein